MSEDSTQDLPLPSEPAAQSPGTQPPEAPSPATIGSWLPLGLLAALLLLQVGAYLGLFHQSDERIQELWAGGTPDQRAWALHVLTNRGEIDADDYGAAFMRSLLADEDMLVREMAFTNDLCKMRPPEIQKRYIAEEVFEDAAHFLRSWCLMKRKVGGGTVGGGLKIARKELEWLFMVENGQEPPLDEMSEHFAERSFMIGVRKGFVDPETGEVTRIPREIDKQ